MRWWFFLFFCFLHFKFLLASLKTLTISRDFTGSRIRISSGEWYVFLSCLYKQHWQCLKENGEPRFNIRKSRQPIIPTVILKSNAITGLKILSGLRNNLQNHRRLPNVPTSFLKRVTGRILTISKYFHKSKSELYPLHYKAANKFKNLWRKYRKYWFDS